MTLPKTLPPLRYNPILDTDSYKIPHWSLYRQGVQRVYSYLESRGGDISPEIMMAGIQPFLYKLGQPIERWQMEEAEEFTVKHFGFREYFNRTGWKSILDKYDGKLQLKIKSLPEGLVVPKRTPMVTIENTQDDMWWLSSYIESQGISDVFPACSLASRAFRNKRKIKPYFDRTSDNGVSPFAMLDFSRRGTFGYNHAEIAGSVFCFMFQGSDNIPGIRYANYYYDKDMSAFSVMATEHSIACGYGKDNDDDYIDDILNKAPVGAIVSMVGDTWDIFKFTQKLCAESRKNVIANKKISLVDRPDSGNRPDVLPPVLKTLCEGFGTRKNSKGFDVINMNVKGLWADGMNEGTITDPFAIAESLGISSDSVMTGSGGGYASADMDRDTDRWAWKASEYVMEDGSRLDIAKSPITDPGKGSKAGRFGVIRHQDGTFETIRRINDVEDTRDLLETRFLNGDVINPTTLDAIRERIESQL